MLLVLILLILSVQQAVEVVHHGMFPGLPGLRRRAEKLWQPGVVLTTWWEVPLKAVACPWCLSLWVAGALSVPAAILAATSFVEFVLLIPLFTLGGSRGANLINDLTYSGSRTPKEEEKGGGNQLSTWSDEAVEEEYHNRVRSNKIS